MIHHTLQTRELTFLSTGVLSSTVLPGLLEMQLPFAAMPQEELGLLGS